MACSEDLSDMLAAISTIRGICAQPENRRDVFNANVVEAIAIGARANNLEIRCEVASILCALSINDENKIQMAMNDDLLLNVIDLLKSNDEPRCLRQAMGCLSNLTERQECHPFIRRHQIHNVILEHFRSKDNGLCREASRFLTNMVSAHENHPPILSGGGIEAFLIGCNKSDAMTARFSVLGLLNLSTLTENHNELLISECYKTLIDLANCQPKTWYTLDYLGELLTDEEPTSPRAKEDCKFLREFNYDKEARRYAVLALGNLAMSDASHLKLMNTRCITALSNCLDSADEETRFNAAFALNKLVRNHKNIQFIGESGVIPRLVDVISSGEPTSKTQAVAVLRHLSNRIENRSLMLQAHLLDPLSVVASQSEDKETLRELTSLTCLLSLSDGLRLPIASSQLLLPLMKLCQHMDVELARHACGTIANLAEAKRTHKVLAGVVNAIHVMIFLMRSKHLSVHREASRALNNMMSSTASHRLFLDDGGLISLFRLCHSLDVETLLNCSLMLRKLSPVLANHDILISKGVLVPLLLLTHAPDIRVRHQAAAAMRDIASNLNYKSIMAEEGGLSRAIELTKDEDLELRIIGMGILRHLAVNTRVKRPIILEGAMVPIYLAIESSVQDIDLLKQCSALLASVAENGENQISMVKDGVLPRLIHLSTINHPEIQQDISKCFASLTANADNHISVFGGAEIKAILRLAESIEENCRRDALVSLGNLAVNAKNQLMITKIGGLAGIGQSLESEFESCQRFACRVLYRLTAHAEIQVQVVESGVIPSVNRLAHSPHPLIRKFAVMALCNVAANSDNHIRLAKLGSISALIDALKDKEDVVVRYATMALTNLATNIDNQIIIPKLGGLSPLIDIAGQDGAESSRYAGMAIANLSSNRQNRPSIVELGGLSPILKMSFATNVETQRSAALAFYNLSCAAVNHLPMIRADCVPGLANLGKSDDLECKKCSTMTLANLAANVDTRTYATRSGGLQTAIAMVKDEDVDVRRYACIALCNMANSPTIQEQIVVHGALPVVLHMAGDASDLESQRQALLTLSNLSANEINHSSMMNKGVMKVLTNGFLSEDLDVREYSSYCIANICSNPDYLAMVGDSGGIPPLIQLTKSDNVNTLCLGMAALRRLANAEENWSRLIAEGILDSLASSGFSTELEIQRETAATICSLSLSEPHRVEMAYKCIQAMIQLSRSNDHDVSRQSIGSLANLAEDVNTHEYIARAGGSKCFVSLEKHNSLEIHREATRGIANLLSSFRHQSTIIQEGIPGLVQLSYSGDDEVCYHAALSFRKLCPNIKSHPVMVYAGVYKALFNLISLPNVNTQHQAASALRDLSANPEYKLKCAEDGGIEVMVHLLRQPDQLLQALSLSSLRHLSTEQALKHPILQERALRPALRSISSNNEDIHLQCAGLLANLSELYENQVTMVEESAVVGLVTLAFSKNIEVQQDSSRALANLASNEESHLALYKQGALTSLVKLSESTSDLAQRYSAMGLRFLASNPEVRVLVVQQRKFDPFIHLASSDLLEYRRTAATAFASFTLHEANKPVLVQGGAVAAILSLAVLDDLAIKRDAAFALANLSDTPELQSDLVR